MIRLLARTIMVFFQLTFALALAASLTNAGAALAGEIGAVVGWVAFLSFLLAWLEANP